MKALLPAAGRGTRVSRNINNKPKCSVEIEEGLPLIVYTVNMLRKKGIDDIYIVTGYKEKIIEEILKDKNINFIYNPFFGITNSIASLWMARDILKDDDFLIMNSDVFCEEAIYDDILKNDKDLVMIYDSSKKVDADYRFNVLNNKICKYGKDLSVEDTTGEYVGIGLIKKDFLPIFKTRMNDFIHMQMYDKWWENVIYSFVGERDIEVYDINPMFWAEVDYIEDYQRIIKFINNNKKI